MGTWRTSLLRLRKSPVTPSAGNQVELMIDGQAFFSRYIEAIESAESYIFIETYIFCDDKTGRKIQQALISKAQKGVEVAVIFDAFGSLSLSDAFIEEMLSAGVRVHEFRPIRWTTRVSMLNRRNHRKILLVDGVLGFVGGMNLADNYAALEDGGDGWRDTAVAVQGPSLVQLESLFRAMWNKCSRIPLQSDPGHSKEYPHGHKVSFIANYGRIDRAEIHRAYIRAINGAKESVRIATAYFTPDRRLLKALRTAAKRGVNVEIITAGATDLEVILHASRGLYGNLLRHGVKVYEYHERVLHAKTAVVDGKWSTVGSANLNHRTWILDQEVNATILGSEFGQKMEHQFSLDRAASRPITRQLWSNRPIWRRITEWFFGLFRRLI
ncbi:MAG: cardiolipin synthase [Myxococcota bacterium]|nr:cardiolipin synthase [Myxococcota bacterium]